MHMVPNPRTEEKKRERVEIRPLLLFLSLQFGTICSSKLKAIQAETLIPESTCVSIKNLGYNPKALDL